MLKSDENLRKRIIQDADQCVKCGLCLPHCPTYGVSKNEAESPRGRINIAKAIANKSLPITEKSIEHLENCLHCGACETMCPATVPYTKLIDNIKMLSHPKQKPFPRFIKFITLKPQWIPLLRKAIYLMQKTSLIKLIQWLKVDNLFQMKRMLNVLPDIKSTQILKTYYPATSTITPQGNVALFRGCMSYLFDNHTIEEGILLLNSLGYGVYIPSQQGCCGALHLHQGDQQVYQKLVEKNKSAFADLNIQAILTFATGCTLPLQSHQEKFNTPILEICQFLNQIKLPEFMITSASTTAISIHIPCTMRNGLSDTTSVVKLFEKLNFSNATLLTTSTCCGAAGINLLQNPKLAETLVTKIRKEIHQKNTSIVVSTNIGCVLHIANTLSILEKKVTIEHPISLIFREKMPFFLKTCSLG